MDSSKKITIAVDGYSSCGKSTLAKALAKKLHYIFIDTGAMYRGITWYALQNGYVKDSKLNASDLIKDLENINIQFGDLNEEGIRKLLVNGRDVSKEIRTMEISDWVSPVATLKEVRQKLVAQQREMGKQGGVIMDGRDIGSVVFPYAELKLFLTADKEIRAERRLLELQHKGEKSTLEDVLKNLEKRDFIDSTREESPLIQVEDAIVIDNSYLTPEEQLQKVLELVQERQMQLAN
ncbi:MAG: (d)CMP kinase [Fluviicola sp.]|jgi:cytidylate kinase